MKLHYITDVDCVPNNYIGGFSPKEKEIIRNNQIGKILHLFSGQSTIGSVRVDLNPDSKATIISDVFEFLPWADTKARCQTVLLDPVYCNTERMELWRERYSAQIKTTHHLSDIYVYPYDSRRTKQLFEFLREYNPARIILKSMDVHTIPGFDILTGYIIEVGAYKPNRTLVIYQSKTTGRQRTLF